MMDRATATRTLRVIWAGMLMSIVVTAAAMLLLMKGQQPTLTLPIRPAIVPFGMLMMLLPGAYFFRLQCYKSGWERFSVTPAAYVKGNIALFAVIEATAIVALVLSAMTTDHQACIIAAGVAFGLLLVNFPNGRPMEPTPPTV